MGWQTESLDNLCDFKNGLWKGKKEPFINVGVIRNTNFAKGGILDDSDIAYLDVEKKQYKTRKLEFGDLILEKSGGGPKQAVGRVIAFEKVAGEFSFSNFTSIMRIKDKDRLHHSFLHKFLYFLYEAGVTETMQRQSTGIRNLQLKEYKLIDVPLPPIPEQQRIVAILDQAFADIEKARANAEQNLKNARELFDSYLQQVFSQRGEGWVETNLATIAENLDSKRVPITKSNRTQGKYPYYGASGIVDYVSDYIFDELLLLISEDGANLLARTYPIAFGASGKYWVNNHAHVLRFKNDKEQKFIEYYLNSISLEPFVSGMAQPKLNQKSLNKIPVPMPNASIVKIVIRKLDALSSEVKRLDAIYNSKLAALDELKKTILQKAFSGELTKSKGIAA